MYPFEVTRVAMQTRKQVARWGGGKRRGHLLRFAWYVRLLCADERCLATIQLAQHKLVR